MNVFTKQKQPCRLREQTFGYQRGKVAGGGGGGGINQVVGINICTLLYIKQIINKDLLYSTENSTQYSVITYKGKESEKEYIYIYMTESLFCTPEAKTQKTNICLPKGKGVWDKLGVWD